MRDPQKMSADTRRVRAIRLMRATRRSDGKYLLYGSTYNSRQQIKNLGGMWNPIKKHWIVNRYVIDTLGALITYKVRIAAYCHEPEQEICCTNEEAESGVIRRGCGMCDRRASDGADVPILEILGEVVIEKK